MKRSYSEAALLTAIEREKKITRAEQYIEAGMTQGLAAVEVGMSGPMLSRFLKRYRESGRNFHSLIPQHRNSGRDSVARKLAKACGWKQFRAILRAVKGLTFDMDNSTGAAWRYYVREHRAELPPAVCEYFDKLGTARHSKHNIAKTLKEPVRVTPLQALRHRGHRAYALAGPYQPRLCDVLPGDIFCSDDTTPIWGWWVPWPVTPETPFGCKALQGQLLPVIDVASQVCISFALIAREKSSYRAADIWALFGHVFDVAGLPRLGFQLERGSWESNLIAGQSIEYADGETPQIVRVGGLKMLPSNVLPWHRRHNPLYPFSANLDIKTSYVPKSKSIEGWFHRNQKLEGCLYGSLGRDQQRKPFEKMKKLFEACKRGAEDPSQNLPSQLELLTRLKRLIEYHLHEETIEGEVFHGKPRDVWVRGLSEHGTLNRLAENQAWLYRREWAVVKCDRSILKIRRADPYTGKTISYCYGAGNWVLKADGRQVRVHFDPQDFEKPAHVCTLHGDYLGTAEYIDRVGTFLASDEIGANDWRRQTAGLVMTAYATCVPHIPSRQLPAEIAARRQAADSSFDTRPSSFTSSSPGSPRHLTGAGTSPSREVSILRGSDDDARGLVPGTNRATAHRMERPGAGTPAEEDLQSRIKDADAFEQKLRAEGALI